MWRGVGGGSSQTERIDELTGSTARAARGGGGVDGMRGGVGTGLGGIILLVLQCEV